jgi:hypothetical protein
MDPNTDYYESNDETDRQVNHESDPKASRGPDPAAYQWQNENDGHYGENDVGLVIADGLGSVVACNCMFRHSSH